MCAISVPKLSCGENPISVQCVRQECAKVHVVGVCTMREGLREAHEGCVGIRDAEGTELEASAGIDDEATSTGNSGFEPMRAVRQRKLPHKSLLVEK